MPKPKRKHTFKYYNIVFERCGEKSTARSMTTPMRMNKRK
jgi:hypothetical protein